jgi:hypothetical protein
MPYAAVLDANVLPSEVASRQTSQAALNDHGVMDR